VSGRATVADVARLAGVSTKTVSRALSGSPNVDPRTLARVQSAAATLRFRPNALARELRSGGSSSTAGFVIGDLTNPFYGQVATGVERVLAREGLILVIGATRDDPRLEAQAVAAMLERRVRALLLVPIADDHGYLEGERHFGTPIVAVDRPLTNAVSDSVVFDNRAGARAGVLALADVGHRRIGFVGSSESLYTHRERLAGYHDALAARGIPLDPGLERTDGPDIASAEKATCDLLDAHPDIEAIFAGNNRAAVGVLLALRERDHRIGLVSFDDFDLAEALGLSVVAHDPQRMGEVAAELAMARLEAPMGPVEAVVLPTRVVLRGSERGVG
jgi:LacI family transcriptional regulator